MRVVQVLIDRAGSTTLNGSRSPDLRASNKLPRSLLPWKGPLPVSSLSKWSWKQSAPQRTEPSSFAHFLRIRLPNGGCERRETWSHKRPETAKLLQRLVKIPPH